MESIAGEIDIFIPATGNYDIHLGAHEEDEGQRHRRQHWSFDNKSLQEPERTDMLTLVVRSTVFTRMCATCIGLSTIFIMYTADSEMQHAGWESSVNAFWIEMAIVSFYVLEWILKLAVHLMYFFCNADMSWNLMDATLAMFCKI